MKKQNGIRLLVAVLGIVFAVLTVAFVLRNAQLGTQSETTEEALYPQTQALLEQVTQQETMDDMLLDELYSGYYSPDDPLVVVNPYNISPLTALVLFQTDTPCKISIHIPGKDAQTEVDYTFSSYETDHIIPVYGLYANTTNPVVFTIQPQYASAYSITIPIETEALSSLYDKLHITVQMEQPDKYEEGFNFLFRTMDSLEGAVALDANGDPRWHLSLDADQYARNYDYNGHYLFAVDYGINEKYIVELDPLGRIYRITQGYESRVHHDLTVYTSDSVLLPYDSVDDPTIEDVIVQLNLTSGEVEALLDLKDVFTQYPNTSHLDSDPFHLNTIVTTDDDSGDVILSLRNLSVLARISWPDGEIRWIAGDVSNTNAMYASKYLTPIGDDFEFFYRQHAPYLMTDLDDNPDTIDLLLFDNGWSRSDYESDLSADEEYSRIVHYRIDEVAMSIEQVAQYGKEFGSGMFSRIHGDANELASGNWLGMFDVFVNSEYINTAPLFVELDTELNPVWTMQIYSFVEDSVDLTFWEYHAERRTIYTDAANTLGIGDAVSLVLDDEITTALDIQVP